MVISQKRVNSTKKYTQNNSLNPSLKGVISQYHVSKSEQTSSDIPNNLEIKLANWPCELRMSFNRILCIHY